jgi:hypothetical protein
LLLAREVQEELEDDHALTGEIILEARNISEPFVPYSFPDELWRQLLTFQNFLMHAHNENLLVVGSVENPDSTALRKTLDIAPQEIV